MERDELKCIDVAILARALEKAQLARQIKLTSFLTGEFKLRSGIIARATSMS